MIMAHHVREALISILSKKGGNLVSVRSRELIAELRRILRVNVNGAYMSATWRFVVGECGAVEVNGTRWVLVSIEPRAHYTVALYRRL